MLASTTTHAKTSRIGVSSVWNGMPSSAKCAMIISSMSEILISTLWIALLVTYLDFGLFLASLYNIVMIITSELSHWLMTLSRAYRDCKKNWVSLIQNFAVKVSITCLVQVLHLIREIPWLWFDSVGVYSVANKAQLTQKKVSLTPQPKWGISIVLDYSYQKYRQISWLARSLASPKQLLHVLFYQSNNQKPPKPKLLASFTWTAMW